MHCRLVLVGALLIGAASVTAQTEDPTINACVVTATGRVRIVDAAGACKRRERPLAWNVEGPAGAAGQDGPPGPQGDTGMPGSSGPPPCQAVGRLSLAGITGDGPGGTMTVHAYHVAVEPGPIAGGPPTIVDFSVTKPIDSASPALAQATLQGTIAATGRLEIFGADHVTVVTTYDLTMVFISGFATGNATVCTSAVPVDTLSLTPGTLSVS